MTDNDRLKTLTALGILAASWGPRREMMADNKADEFEGMSRTQMVGEIKRLRRDVEGYTRTLDAREARIRELSDLQARLERQVKERDAKIAEQARRLEQMPRLDDRICAARSALKDSLSLLNEAHTLVKK